MQDAVDIQNLSFSYANGQPALTGINLRIEPGQKIALVGPNGAGKSTLLMHLNGILRGQGSIRICGLEINDENVARIRALVGMVFQSPDDQLFSTTVFDDVAFGPLYQGLPRREIEKRVDEALDAVHMRNFKGRSSYHLSVGEKKRIAIATVLSMQPQVLALDEPSAGLDPRARRSLIRLLDELPQTMLVATHDLALVRDLLPFTVIMDGGSIITQGATSHILADQELLSKHGLDE